MYIRYVYDIAYIQFMFCYTVLRYYNIDNHYVQCILFYIIMCNVYHCILYYVQYILFYTIMDNMYYYIL